MTNVKIALYTRVSTRDKQDVTKQRDYLINFLNLKNQREDEDKWELFEIYVDKGISGTKAKRPALDDMLRDIDKFDVVLVYKLDRIGRSMKHLFTLMEIFKEKDVQFVSATQSIDTTTPEGKLFFNILAAMAEFESEVTRMRIIDGLASAKARGVKLGRKKGAKDRKARSRVGYFLRHERERNKVPRSRHKQLLENIKNGK